MNPHEKALEAAMLAVHARGGDATDVRAAIAAYNASLAEQGCMLVDRERLSAVVTAAVAALKYLASETNGASRVYANRYIEALGGPPVPLVADRNQAQVMLEGWQVDIDVLSAE